MAGEFAQLTLDSIEGGVGEEFDLFDFFYFLDEFVEERLSLEPL